MVHGFGVFSPSWEFHAGGKLNGSIWGRHSLGDDGQMPSVALSTQKQIVISAPAVICTK